MHQNSIAAMIQLCAKLGHRVQPIQIGQLTIMNRQVDVQKMIGRLRHAVIDPAVKVNDGVDAAIENRLPILNRRRKKQPAIVIHLHDFFEHAHGR